MFLEAYAAACIIIVMAIVIGRAICLGAGRDQRWHAAPAVGLASLLVLESAAIKLPGRADTAIAVAGLAFVVAAVHLVRHGKHREVRVGDGLIVVLALVGASLPFIANGRIGLQGVSVDNDTAWHLLWAEGLRSARMAALWPPSAGYPLGPHSLVASLGTAIGSPLDMVFTGLLLAVVSITALVAAGVVSGESLWRRVVVGVLCALAYLVAAYYAEGAFKETIMGLLVLGFALHLEQVSARWGESAPMTRWWLVSPAVLLVAGAVYTYSYTAAAWFGVALVLWTAVSVIRRPRTARAWLSTARLRREGGWLAGAAILIVLVFLPVIGPVISFFRTYGLSAASTGAIGTSNLGNLSGRLSPYEMFGIWTNPDFRLIPTNVFRAGEFGALGLAVAAYGAWWALRRGKVLLVSTMAACLLIWWRADTTQSPYVSAKALAIAAPLVMAVALAGLLTRRDGPPSSRLLRFAAAALFCALSGYSSYDALRHQPVQAPEQGRELAAFAKTIGDSSVLFLGNDEFATWQLRPATVSALFPPEPSHGGASPRVSKPFLPGIALDFDSVAPRDIDNFNFVITTSSPYASQPPSNFRLVAQRRLYDLWQRSGPTASREVIESPGTPGATLNCHSAAGERLRASGGRASLMATPVTVPGPNFLPAGGFASVALALPEGRWELSLQYISSFDFEVSAPGASWRMPAYLGRQGPFFAVGAVTGRGPTSPITLLFAPERPSFLTGRLDNLFTYVPTIVATRLPDSRQTVPVSQACGNYVDWYQPR